MQKPGERSRSEDQRSGVREIPVQEPTASTMSGVDAYTPTTEKQKPKKDRRIPLSESKFGAYLQPQEGGSSRRQDQEKEYHDNRRPSSLRSLNRENSLSDQEGEEPEAKYGIRSEPSPARSLLQDTRRDHSKKGTEGGPIPSPTQPYKPPIDTSFQRNASSSRPEATSNNLPRDQTKLKVVIHTASDRDSDSISPISSMEDLSKSVPDATKTPSQLRRFSGARSTRISQPLDRTTSLEKPDFFSSPPPMQFDHERTTTPAPLPVDAQAREVPSLMTSHPNNFSSAHSILKHTNVVDYGPDTEFGDGSYPTRPLISRSEGDLSTAPPWHRETERRPGPTRETERRPGPPLVTPETEHIDILNLKDDGYRPPRNPVDTHQPWEIPTDTRLDPIYNDRPTPGRTDKSRMRGHLRGKKDLIEEAEFQLDQQGKRVERIHIYTEELAKAVGLAKDDGTGRMIVDLAIKKPSTEFRDDATARLVEIKYKNLRLMAVTDCAVKKNKNCDNARKAIIDAGSDNDKIHGIRAKLIKDNEALDKSMQKKLAEYDTKFGVPTKDARMLNDIQVVESKESKKAYIDGKQNNMLARFMENEPKLKSNREDILERVALTFSQLRRDQEHEGTEGEVIHEDPAVISGDAESTGNAKMDRITTLIGRQEKISTSMQELDDLLKQRLLEGGEGEKWEEEETVESKNAGRNAENEPARAPKYGRNPYYSSIIKAIDICIKDFESFHSTLYADKLTQMHSETDLPRPQEPSSSRQDSIEVEWNGESIDSKMAKADGAIKELTELKILVEQRELLLKEQRSVSALSRYGTDHQIHQYEHYYALNEQKKKIANITKEREDAQSIVTQLKGRIESAERDAQTFNRTLDDNDTITPSTHEHNDDESNRKGGGKLGSVMTYNELKKSLAEAETRLSKLDGSLGEAKEEMKRVADKYDEEEKQYKSDDSKEKEYLARIQSIDDKALEHDRVIQRDSITAENNLKMEMIKLRHQMILADQQLMTSTVRNIQQIHLMAFAYQRLFVMTAIGAAGAPQNSMTNAAVGTLNSFRAGN